jgi:hypothetical protein
MVWYANRKSKLTLCLYRLFARYRRPLKLLLVFQRTTEAQLSLFAFQITKSCHVLALPLCSLRPEPPASHAYTYRLFLVIHAYSAALRLSFCCAVVTSAFALFLVIKTRLPKLSNKQEMDTEGN